MVLLDQDAIALADLRSFGVMGQTHLVEGAGLKARAAAGALFFRHGLAGVAVVEPVLRAAPGAGIAHPRSPPGGADRPSAKAPGRLMAKAGRGLEIGDLRLGHSVEEVIALVIFGGMALTEPVMILRHGALAGNLDRACGIGLGGLAHAQFVTTFMLAAL